MTNKIKGLFSQLTKKKKLLKVCILLLLGLTSIIPYKLGLTLSILRLG